MKKIITIILGIFIGIILVSLVTGIIVYKKTFIGKEKAKEIVFGELKITEKDVKRLEVDFDRDGKYYEYTVEFIYENKEYEYKLDAKTGEIIIFEIDR